jgi:hypothetical protein
MEQVNSILETYGFERQEFSRALAANNFDFAASIEEMQQERYYSTDSFIVSDSEPII